jgi:hypothetical protein
MQQTYWQRQALDKPLFPDLLWSRPENRTFAGKLLIIGGNAHGFAAPANAFTEAERSGIGVARVLLPDSLRATIGRVFVAGEYAPSTPSGSFGQQTLAELIAMSDWSDGVLFAGDLGRNSETAILLEQSVATYKGQLTITKDALDYLTSAPQAVLQRPNTLLVASFAQLQKIATRVHFPTAFTFSMDLLRLIELLHEFTTRYDVWLITKHLDTICVAGQGQVSTTKVSEQITTWRVTSAAHAATWWLQTPSKPFAAMTSAVFDTYGAHAR